MDRPRRQLRKRSTYEREQDPQEGPNGPKRTPLFVADPGAPSRRVVTALSPSGSEGRSVEADTAEAASHWDVRWWRQGLRFLS